MTEKGKQQIRRLCCTDEIADKLIEGIEREEKMVGDMEKKEAETFCDYPMSEFYTFRAMVPPNTRVSNKSDCESCEEDCEDKNCLITENEGERVEKKKKCESKCPYCGSGNVDYGVSFSVADGWYHQRGTCLDCNKCFTEVSEMTYRSTMLNEE